MSDVSHNLQLALDKIDLVAQPRVDQVLAPKRAEQLLLHAQRDVALALRTQLDSHEEAAALGGLRHRARHDLLRVRDRPEVVGGGVEGLGLPLGAHLSAVVLGMACSCKRKGLLFVGAAL